MRWRSSAALLLVAASGWVPTAEAQPACPPLEVIASRAVLARWPELAERIEATFADRSGIDTCASVSVSRDGDAIELEVRLADGRLASRRVTDEEDVIPSLEALLLLPHTQPLTAAAEPRPTSTAAPRPRARSRPARWLGVQERPIPAGPSEIDADRTGIDVALAADARLGDGRTALGLGVLALFEASGWLSGTRVRTSEYMDGSVRAPSSSFTTIELAALAGRRVRFEGLALDLVAGPAVAIEMGKRTETELAPSKEPESPSSSLARFVASGHLEFAPRSTFRPFAGLEAELGAVGDEAAGGAFELPVWMVGVALGLATGTP